MVDALHEFPHMNASMGDGSVVLHDEVHLSIAVDLDYQGLLAPVVRNAHDKRLRAIGRDIHDLAGRARTASSAPTSSRVARSPSRTRAATARSS